MSSIETKNTKRLQSCTKIVPTKVATSSQNSQKYSKPKTKKLSQIKFKTIQTQGIKYLAKPCTTKIEIKYLKLKATVRAKPLL